MRHSLKLRHGFRLERLEARDVPAVYNVTTAGDAGAGSLRQAILDANGHAGADQIRFSLGATPVSIHLLSSLPAVTDTVDIDGAIDTSHHSNIVLDGSAQHVWHHRKTAVTGYSHTGFIRRGQLGAEHAGRAEPHTGKPP